MQLVAVLLPSTSYDSNSSGVTRLLPPTPGGPPSAAGMFVCAVRES